VAVRLQASGEVHVVDINDNPMARARLSALMAATVLERSVGIETIPHVTPRDASVMGLQSQLLGAHAEGVRNVLAITGDPPHVGDYPGSSGVYDVDAVGLVSLLGHLNRGEDFSGKAIDAPTSFYVGVAVNPSSDDLDRELERFGEKLEAGARFAMTQALFDLDYLDRFLDRLGGESPIPLLVGVWPLTSHQLAFRLHNEVPGITIPGSVQERLADAGADARAVGFELARELTEGVRSRAGGIYVIPPFKEPTAALELLTP
jgi:homocysteine S-methyltransferase